MKRLLKGTKDLRRKSELELAQAMESAESIEVSNFHLVKKANVPKVRPSDAR